LWSKHYRGENNTLLQAYSGFINAYDNGIIVAAGYVDTIGIYPPLLMKLDSAGNLVWAKSMPVMNGFYNSVYELSDSSLVGSLYVSSNPYALLQKLDKNGNIIWTKQTNFTASEIREKTNGNILTFNPNASMFLKEFDSNGNDIWEKKYTNTAHVFNAWTMDVNNIDQVIIISDLFDSTGQITPAMYVLKTDALGHINFSNGYSGSWTQTQTYAGSFTKDCGIVVNSRLIYLPSAIREKQAILKLDSLGNTQWLRAYNFSSVDAHVKSIVNTPDFGYASLAQVPPGNPLYTKIIKQTSMEKHPAIMIRLYL
jgi:hypothetical protein